MPLRCVCVCQRCLFVYLLFPVFSSSLLFFLLGWISRTQAIRFGWSFQFFCVWFFFLPTRANDGYSLILDRLNSLCTKKRSGTITKEIRRDSISLYLTDFAPFFNWSRLNNRWVFVSSREKSISIEQKKETTAWFLQNTFLSACHKSKWYKSDVWNVEFSSDSAM